jgi:REase_AHJR-like
MNVHLTELGYLREMVPQLEAEGFDVYLQPSKLLVPSFLGDFRPDALALRKDKKLVIEVISNRDKKSADPSKVASLFSGQNEWELRLIVMNSANTGINPAIQKAEAINESLANLNGLIGNNQHSAVLLLGWATFEALSRVIMPATFTRPQTPARLIQEMAMEGAVTPKEAETLRALADKRNRLIHGDLATKVSKTDAVKFVRVLEGLQKTKK